MEQHRITAAPTSTVRTGRSSVRSIPRWLRERLLPGGENVLVLAAYAIILTALATFIAIPPPAPLPAWRFYSTILGLLTMLALYVAAPDLEARFGQRRAGLIILFAGGTLCLLVNWLGGFAQFLAFLLFMLTAEAFVDLRPRYALVYSVSVATSWLLLFWIGTGSREDVANAAVSLSLGMIFSGTFALALAAYGKQTTRAELLLRELRTANAELSAAREREKALAAAQERVRLAREIHDGLGHHLTALNVQLQAAAKLVGRDPDRAEETIAICREEAHAALEEVRSSVAAMRGTPLDGRSLDEALYSLVRDFDRRSPLDARFSEHGDAVPLAPAAAITFYRAAQEGLTNVQKHAHATCVTVTLEFTLENVRLRVEDDGTGIASTGGGFGLAGLRERAEQLGGAFSARHRDGGGFQLELSIPQRRSPHDPRAAR